MFSQKNRQSLFIKFPQLQEIPEEKFPKHIFIIPDGNGRWAKAHKQFVTFGHRKGAQIIENILEDIAELPLKIVTIYGFASDNWKRETNEVKGLMFLFTHTINNTLKKLKARNGRLIHLGRKDRIPQELLKTIENAEKDTQENTGQILCLAIDFGGDDQDMRMIDAARKLSPETPITKEILWQLRDGQGFIPPADLIFRTSGEKRISDIGWLNGAPTELYFTDKLFPDMTTEDLIDAIVDFSKRERRFGGRKKELPSFGGDKKTS